MSRHRQIETSFWILQQQTLRDQMRTDIRNFHLEGFKELLHLYIWVGAAKYVVDEILGNKESIS
jgi:hypothetical protein